MNDISPDLKEQW